MAKRHTLGIGALNAHTGDGCDNLLDIYIVSLMIMVKKNIYTPYLVSQ